MPETKDTLSLVERLTAARKGARTEEDAKAIADAQNEIERLQHIKDVAQALAEVEREAIAAERARVIEECAKVAEHYGAAFAHRISAAIRALGKQTGGAA